MPKMWKALGLVPSTGRGKEKKTKEEGRDSLNLGQGYCSQKRSGDCQGGKRQGGGCMTVPKFFHFWASLQPFQYQGWVGG